MNRKALIIDGHNFLFRGYYGVPPEAKRSDGTPINAVYGFFSLLRYTQREINSGYIVVMFDSETSIDQKRIVRPEYKANRPLDNGLVYSQLPLIKKCLDLLGITWIESKNFEADDLIGTYAEMFSHQNIQSYIASSDCDFMQLVSEKILVVRGRHGSVDIYDMSKVLDSFGVSPKQYLDYLTLVGDASDNIRGIKGIGKKRASDLLSKYKDIKSIYKSIDSLSEILKRLLSGHESFLINQKKFLEIKKDIKLAGKFKIKDYSFSEDVLPDKMGKFLDDNWKRLI